MKRKAPVLVTALLACVLVIAGLTACSGGSGKSSAPAPSDEDLIRADIEKTIGTYIDKDEWAKGMKADEDIQELMQYGFDVDAIAESFASKFKIEVTDIKVNGESAIATIDILMPNFGSEETDQMLDDVLEKKMASIDLMQLSEEEIMKILVDSAVEVMSDPNFPTKTETLDLDYVKKDSQWSLKDLSETEALLSEKVYAAAGL